MDTNQSFNLKGVLFSHLMLIPHYLLMFLIILTQIFRKKDDVLLKISGVIFFCLFAFVIIPWTLISDFWFLAEHYSTMSFGEATRTAFIETPLIHFPYLIEGE